MDIILKKYRESHKKRPRDEDMPSLVELPQHSTPKKKKAPQKRSSLPKPKSPVRSVKKSAKALKSGSKKVSDKKQNPSHRFNISSSSEEEAREPDTEIRGLMSKASKVHIGDSRYKLPSAIREEVEEEVLKPSGCEVETPDSAEAEQLLSGSILIQ